MFANYSLKISRSTQPHLAIYSNYCCEYVRTDRSRWTAFGWRSTLSSLESWDSQRLGRSTTQTLPWMRMAAKKIVLSTKCTTPPLSQCSIWNYD